MIGVGWSGMWGGKVEDESETVAKVFREWGGLIKRRQKPAWRGSHGHVRDSLNIYIKNDSKWL